ncbi:MAG: deoxyguanosinetriphosphate triphosphohydrolase [Reinekea forsetii]|nr:deoxyguanosinetriphosphate triphosphohydrolase [Reinekea forsetii]
MTPMNWHQLLTTARFGHDAPGPADMGRSHFHKDHDRIVFSGAFRKLGGKTQVHPLAKYNHIHNRLIHSMEVGSVGRSLGIRVAEIIKDQLPEGIEPDDLGIIVQAACLAHDIGNPPFGHAGEYAIQDWFKRADNQIFLSGLTDLEKLDLQSFEGNAQGFRTLAQVEYHLNNGGLRLTFPTLGTSLKYPWTAEQAGANGKFSCFRSEHRFLQELANRLGLIQQPDGRLARHPLSYLMEAADDICYALIDLEDAVELSIIEFVEVEEIFLDIQGTKVLNLNNSGNISPGRQLSALRSKTIGCIVDAVVATYVTHLDSIMAATFTGDLISACPERIRNGINRAKNLAINKVFMDVQKTETEIGAYTVLSVLLKTFIEAGFEFHQKRDRKTLSYRTKRVFDLMAGEAPTEQMSQYEIYQRMVDNIAGMTDNYALYLAKQISAPS